MATDGLRVAGTCLSLSLDLSAIIWPYLMSDLCAAAFRVASRRSRVRLEWVIWPNVNTASSHMRSRFFRFSTVLSLAAFLPWLVPGTTAALAHGHAIAEDACACAQHSDSAAENVAHADAPCCAGIEASHHDIPPNDCSCPNCPGGGTHDCVCSFCGKCLHASAGLISASALVLKQVIEPAKSRPDSPCFRLLRPPRAA